MKLFNSVFFRFFLVGLIAIGFMVWAYHIQNPGSSQPQLDVFGPLNDNGTEHTVADFSFIDQTGKTVTQKDFEGKIFVSDFFFATCEGICPIMSGEMQRVAEHFKNEQRLKFLSHTVKPEEDSVEVLAEYATLHNADPSQWHFVTGDKAQLYEMARKSYLVTISEGDGGPQDFVHTQFFALVDTKRRIRGYYDGTDSVEVNRLLTDIGILLQEK